MLIGIDASRANREQKTGTEWYSYHLIEELKKIPLEKGVFFILYSQEPLRGDLGKLPEGWQSRVLRWPPKFLWTQIKLAEEMKKNPPDVLFIPAHVIPRVHPEKVITVSHDLGFRRFPRAYSFWQRFYLDWSTKFALKHASKIIAISEFTKQELIDIYNLNGGSPASTISSKIEVVHLGYDPQLFHSQYSEAWSPNIEKVLAKYKIAKPYILYVGRLEEKKNVAGLIEAFKLFTPYTLHPTPYTLVLVGKPGYGYKKVKSQKSKVKSIVELGYVERKDLPYLYAGAEAFVFPSFYEGFGMPVLEAMACGTPVVASNTTSIPEVAGDAALLIDPENPHEIAEAIKQVIEDKNLRERLIQKGLERVKNFSWQKCARETLKILLSN